MDSGASIRAARYEAHDATLHHARTRRIMDAAQRDDDHGASFRCHVGGYGTTLRVTEQTATTRRVERVDAVRPLPRDAASFNATCYNPWRGLNPGLSHDASSPIASYPKSDGKQAAMRHTVDNGRECGAALIEVTRRARRQQFPLIAALFHYYRRELRNAPKVLDAMFQNVPRCDRKRFKVALRQAGVDTATR